MLPNQFLKCLFGFGFALVQIKHDGRLSLIQCGSCSLSPAQKNYATIELEASAIMWAVFKCDHYLRGMRSFVVVTDHKPLKGIFEKPLGAMMNGCLQGIREKLFIYKFSLKWNASGMELRLVSRRNSTIIELLLFYVR